MFALIAAIRRVVNLPSPQAGGGRCRASGGVAALLVALSVPVQATAQHSRQTPQPGRAFQSADTRRLEADEVQNPGWLWVEEGAKLWARPEGPSGKSCETCHGVAETALTGVAAHYPKYDAGAGGLLNIEGRIQRCRTVSQGGSALAYESNELLALTMLVSSRARGVPRRVDITGPAAPFFEAGRTFWQTRQGQLNVACAQCHDELVGKLLRGDRISQGQSDGWPAYRLEWQTLGSLHRRLRACSIGVRAKVLDYGAPEYLAVELYLAGRGEGLPMSAPGVRR